MAWSHIGKAKYQHYETGLDVEPSGQAKEGDRKTPGDVILRQTQPGLSWQKLERIAQDRRRWREVLYDLCSRRSQGPKQVNKVTCGLTGILKQSH